MFIKDCHQEIVGNNVTTEQYTNMLIDPTPDSIPHHSRLTDFLANDYCQPVILALRIWRVAQAEASGTNQFATSIQALYAGASVEPMRTVNLSGMVADWTSWRERGSSSL
jgi:hypothetical protein